MKQSIVAAADARAELGGSRRTLQEARRGGEGVGDGQGERKRRGAERARGATLQPPMSPKLLTIDLLHPAALVHVLLQLRQVLVSCGWVGGGEGGGRSEGGGGDGASCCSK